MSRTGRIINALSSRIAMMSHTALSFRAVIQRFGNHLAGCPRDPCACGWARVDAFMADDANFGEVKHVQQLAVEDQQEPRVILASR